MKKLLFSLLFFSAIAIGSMAADGTLVNSGGTTTVGGSASPGSYLTNNLSTVTVFTNNFSVSNSVSSQGVKITALTGVLESSGGLQSGGNIQAINASFSISGGNTSRIISNPTGPILGLSVVGTNAVLTTGQVNTTAGTANNWTSNNIYCGRVRISSGSQSYFVTNTAVTTSSIILAAVNTADATAFSCQAIPTSGLLQLKLNGVSAGDCDISWRIVSP